MAVAKDKEPIKPVAPKMTATRMLIAIVKKRGLERDAAQTEKIEQTARAEDFLDVVANASKMLDEGKTKAAVNDYLTKTVRTDEIAAKKQLIAEAEQVEEEVIEK